MRYGVLVQEPRINAEKDLKLVMADKEYVQIPLGHRRTIAEHLETVKSHIAKHRAGIRLRRPR